MRITKRSLALVLSLFLIAGLMVPTAFAAGTGDMMDPIVCESVSDLPATLDLDPGEVVYFTAPVGGAAISVSDIYGWAGVYNAMTGMCVGTEYDCSDAPEGYSITFGIGNQNPMRPTTVTITVGAPAPAEVGTEENPAEVEWNSNIGYWVMNTELAEGDEDGYWYTLELEAGKVLFVETSPAGEFDYEVVVYQGWNQLLASEGNPVITYRAEQDETILIHVFAEPDSSWNYPAGKVYVSAKPCTATEEDPIPVKSKDVFKLPVASGDTVCFVDNAQGVISESGLVFGAMEEAVALSSVTVDGVVYTDTDADGAIEVQMNGG